MIAAVNEGCQNIFRIFKKLSVLMSKMISQSFVLARDVLVVQSEGEKKKTKLCLSMNVHRAEPCMFHLFPTKNLLSVQRSTISILSAVL